ncbi:hypothetical protein [Campylobacter gastrosuis]|uniref:Flagellar-associated protein FlgQ n=1 Tax=Campylobacter gastrosuis TaxID=2974576 RepID=A0ABT7HTD9_9BACT|nr:hypothetical protein [Campylobacter gastrosuis]MDL0089898.1 hypothetical protein [Campylobacter gastrosuis]
MARSLCLLIALINFTFSSEEFIFWANVSVKNYIISSQNLNISKSMVKSTKSSNYICEIFGKKDENQTTISFLKRHEDALFECFANQKINVQDEIKKQGINVYKNTNLAIKPIHFTIEFKPNSAIILVFQGR